MKRPRWWWLWPWGWCARLEAECARLRGDVSYLADRAPLRMEERLRFAAEERA